MKKRTNGKNGKARTKVLVMGGQKGGSGKSTMAIHLLVHAMEDGCSVLLVDCDRQGSARTWSAVAQELGQPAPTTISILEPVLHKPGQLDRVSKGYDLVLIDCPAGITPVQRSALAIADVLVMLCEPSYTDTWSMEDSMKELVEEMQLANPRLRPCVVLNRVQETTRLGRGARDMFDKGVQIAETALCQRIAYKEALGAGLGVTTYEPEGPGALEIRNLYGELLQLMRRVH